MAKIGTQLFELTVELGILQRQLPELSVNETQRRLSEIRELVGSIDEELSQYLITPDRRLYKPICN